MPLANSANTQAVTAGHFSSRGILVASDQRPLSKKARHIAGLALLLLTLVAVGASAALGEATQNSPTSMPDLLAESPIPADAPPLENASTNPDAAEGVPHR